MKYDPLTFIGLLNHIEDHIDLMTVGLLRESGEQSSRDMLQFQVGKYLEDESSKSKPDIALKYFDFNGFSTNWLSPHKENQVDAIGNLSLSDIVKDIFCNIQLPKNYHKDFAKLINKAIKQDLTTSSHDVVVHFFSLLNNKKYDPNFYIAMIRFIKFGRMIFANNQANRMELLPTAKMMAPCFTRLFFGSTLSSQEIKSYSAFFQNILECCLPLTSEQFECLAQVDKKAYASKTHRQALINSLFIEPHSQSEASSSTSPHSTASGSTTTSSFDISQTDGPGLLFSVPKADIYEFAKTGNVEELRRYFANKPNAAELVNSSKFIFGRSLLHTAVLFQQPDVIRFLNSIGASIHVMDKHNRTPLHYAAAWPNYYKPFDAPTLTTLLEIPGAYLCAKLKKDSDGKSAIELAKENNVIAEFEGCLIRSVQTLDKAPGTGMR